ncbi:hypothetical protein D1872_246350 [compost metagenome]
MKHLTAEVVRNLRSGRPSHFQPLAHILTQTSVDPFKTEALFDHLLIPGITAGRHHYAFCRNLQGGAVGFYRFDAGHLSVLPGHKFFGRCFRQNLASMLFYGFGQHITQQLLPGVVSRQHMQLLPRKIDKRSLVAFAL